jgi:RimJ/RimL family protein N-acetyltransferase
MHFSELGMTAVNSDTIIKNKRSQHILEKIGFKFLKQEDEFRMD